MEDAGKSRAAQSKPYLLAAHAGAQQLDLLLGQPVTLLYVGPVGLDEAGNILIDRTAGRQACQGKDGQHAACSRAQAERGCGDPPRQARGNVGEVNQSVWHRCATRLDWGNRYHKGLMMERRLEDHDDRPK